MRFPQLPELGAVTIPPGVNPNDPESLLSHARNLFKIKDIDGAGHFSFLAVKVADALAWRQTDPREREKFRRMSEAAEAFRAKLFEVKEEYLVPTEEALLRPLSEKWVPFASRIPRPFLREGLRRIMLSPGAIPEEEEVAAEFEKKAVRSLFLLGKAKEQAQTAVTREGIDAAIKTASKAMEDAIGAQTTARVFAPWFPKDVTKRRSWVSSIGGKSRELIDSLLKKKIQLSIDEASKAMAPFSKASKEIIPSIIAGKASSSLLAELRLKADEVLRPALSVITSTLATKGQKKLAEEILKPVRQVRSIIESGRREGIIPSFDPWRFIKDFPQSIDSLEKASEAVRAAMAISYAVSEGSLPPTVLDPVKIGLKKVDDFVSKVAITGTFPERWEAERILLSSSAARKSMGVEYTTPILSLIGASREFLKQSLRMVHGIGPKNVDSDILRAIRGSIERVKELASRVMDRGTPQQREKVATLMTWSRHLEELIEKSKA